MRNVERAEWQRLRRVYAARQSAGRDDRYTPYDPANIFRLQSLERSIASTLLAEGLLPWENRVALDVGCGGGWWLRQLLCWGARPEQLVGVDALPGALAAAATVHPRVGLFQANADRLPIAAHTIDMVTQFTVFSSILSPAVRQRAASEMVRVVRPGGVIVWYDFVANPTNRDTVGIGRRALSRLFPGCHMTVRSVTLAPPLARWVVPRAWLIAEALQHIPALRTHLLAVVHPPHRAEPAR